MKISTLFDVLCAAHWTSKVESRFPSRGGVMMVAPPGHLKTTLIMRALEEFPDAHIVSDLVTQSIVRIREEIAGNKIRTLALTDFQKVYERHEFTASNIEGNVRALVDEGFTRTATEDSRMQTMPARCLVVAGMTSAMYLKRFSGWQDSGFVRRFLWCQFRLKNPERILEAIHHWKPLDFQRGRVFFVPVGATIPYELAERESIALSKLVRHQGSPEIPFLLLKKIACVLKWRDSQASSGRKSKAAASTYMEVLTDFGECLRREGAEVVL